MNKWYKSSLTKGILLVAAHILCIVMSVSLLWLSGYAGIASGMLAGEKMESCEESKAFGEQVWHDGNQILDIIENQSLFDEAGELKKDMKIDILQYYQEDKISQENESGLLYRVEDLYNLSNTWEADEGDIASGGENQIVVCKKADSTYDYYYYKDFQKVVEEKKLKFTATEEDKKYTTDQVMNMIQMGNMPEGGYESSIIQVVDEDGVKKYDSVWGYDGVFLENFPVPEGYENTIELANQDERWNGNLNEIYSLVWDAVTQLTEEIDTYESFLEQWQEGDTNLAYMYVDLDEKKVYTNKGEYQEYGGVQDALADMKASGKYAVIRPKLSDCETNMNEIDMQGWKYSVKERSISEGEFLYVVQVDTEYPIQDKYYQQNQTFKESAPNIRSVFAVAITSALWFIVVFIWLTVIAGRRPEDGEIHLHWIDRIKTELTAVPMFILIYFLVYFGIMVGARSYQITGSGSYGEFLAYRTYGIESFIGIACVAFCLCSVCFITYLSFVRRVKAKTLWKNSILCSICKFLKMVVQNIQSIWKVMLIFAGFVLIHWIAISSMGMGPFPVIMFGSEFAAAVYLIRRGIGQKKIVKGLERICGGEINYQIPLKGIKGEQLVVAQRINSIGEGLDAAVEASMKNERMRTDLITNVSHDIKTPLTSIINYVDLLKREKFTDSKINGYLDILEAKAQRLKTLTEDVVEASKVSSGTITLEYMNINLVEMIQQTSGEFEEKFAKRNLTEVLTLPEEEAVICADGRRVWRVLENIYNNAAKYAMEGTRIYADLRASQKTVVFTLKNVSEQPLNISADELTERFIRGDVSRSTEGSGLGLSIAKNLAEMQGGQFETYVDGDLFRVTITFARITKRRQEK